MFQVVLGKENDTGREFAIKMLEKKHLIKEKKVKYATTERDILTKCSNHPNIVKLYCTFKDDTYLCILIIPHSLIVIIIIIFPKNILNFSLDYVLELCPNGELLDQLKKVIRFVLIFVNQPDN